MIDYNEVKRYYADKLASDFDGTGRVESAFYHTMKMVYLKGVEDGQQLMIHGNTERAESQIIGVYDSIEKIVWHD